MSAARSAVVAVALACSLVSPVLAQQGPPAQRHGHAGAVATFLTGAAVGLGLHESGHLLLDGLFHASPGVDRVSAGFIPFFAITHQPVSPVREFAISSAGFWVQHATDEFVLGHRPRLRFERAPFAKGLVAFNVVTSVMYAGAAFSRRGPLQRDTRGMAVSAGVGEPWIGVSVLAPAVLDAARYARPSSAWLRWTSRGAKVAGVLVIVKAHRGAGAGGRR